MSNTFRRVCRTEGVIQLNTRRFAEDVEIVVFEGRGDRFCVFGRRFGGVGEDAKVDAMVVFEDIGDAKLLLQEAPNSFIGKFLT